jgi:hypothetical protein
MSYDFSLLPRNPGQSWHQVMEANERRVLEEGDRPLSPAARTRLEQIADRLQTHDPQLERFTTERYIELTRVDDAGIQVSLFSSELALSIAYWRSGPSSRAVMRIVWSYLAILEEETGWEIYDGQLGRSLDRGHDLDEVTGWYAELSSRLHWMFPECPADCLTLKHQGNARRSRFPRHIPVAVGVAVSVRLTASPPVYAALRAAPIDTHKHVGKGRSGLIIRGLGVGFPPGTPRSG